MRKLIRTIKLPVLVMAMICCWLVLFLMACHSKGRSLHYTTFESNKGWGYNILAGRQVIIRQELVPVFEEQKGFATQAQAEGAARKVIRKLAEGKPPTLGEEELKSLLGENK